MYDASFFVDNEGVPLREHSQINRLSTITPQNNTVVCYEFSYLYSKFLEEQRINHEIKFGIRSANDVYDARGENERKSYGGTTHAFCVVRADDIVFMADSTTTSFGGDLINAKIGRDLEGLKIVSREPDKKREFDSAIRKTKELSEQGQSNTSMPNLLKAYRGLTAPEIRNQNIDVAEKVDCLKSLLESTEKTHGLENYYYLSRVN